MEIRVINESEKKEFFDVLWYCHPEPKAWHDTEEKLFYNKECIACFEDNKIIAGMQVRKYLVNFNGKEIIMGGLAAVAMSPENRYKGKTTEFMKYVLKFMKDNEIILSALNPFSYSFYRKYGWDSVCNRLKFELKFEAISNFNNSKYKFKKLDLNDFEKKTHVFNRYYKNLNGSVVYDDFTYNRKKEILKAFAYHTYICVNEDGNSCGFVNYRFADGKLIISDMGYENIDAQKAIWGFIYSHNSSFDKIVAFLPTNDLTIKYIEDLSDQDIKIVADMMYRIVDLKKALALLNVKKEVLFELNLKVTDKYAKWNDDTFYLIASNGKISVKRKNVKADCEIDVTALSQLYMGAVTIDELEKLNRIKIINNKVKGYLNNIFTSKATYIQERFLKFIKMIDKTHTSSYTNYISI